MESPPVVPVWKSFPVVILGVFQLWIWGTIDRLKTVYDIVPESCEHLQAKYHDLPQRETNHCSLGF
jgi:hypothetical protein